MVRQMKVKCKQTVVQMHDIEVPEYFGYDDTARGRVVDVLLRDFVGRDERTIRDKLKDEDEYVGHRVEELRRAYETADLILGKLGYK